MRRGIIAFCLFIALTLAGCGGGGGGGGGTGGGGTNANPDVPLLGTWQPVSATVSGTADVVPMATAFGWDSNCTREEQEFRQDGGWVKRLYQGTALSNSTTGTWSSDEEVASIITGGQTTTMSYWSFGDTLAVTFSRGNATYDTLWISTTAPTAHDGVFAKTYTLTGITIDGNDSTIADYFQLHSMSNTVTLELAPGGTLALRELHSGSEVDRKNGTWASGEGTVFMVIEGETWRTIVDADGVTYLDSEGKTIKLTWSD